MNHVREKVANTSFLKSRNLIGSTTIVVDTQVMQARVTRPLIVRARPIQGSGHARLVYCMCLLKYTIAAG